MEFIFKNEDKNEQEVSDPDEEEIPAYLLTGTNKAEKLEVSSSEFTATFA